MRLFHFSFLRKIRKRQKHATTLNAPIATDCLFQSKYEKKPTEIENKNVNATIFFDMIYMFSYMLACSKNLVKYI